MKFPLDPKIKEIKTYVSEYHLGTMKELARDKGLTMASLLREAIWYYERFEQRKMYAGARKTRLLKARKKGRHTRREWDRLVKEFGGVCLRCGDPDVTKDHIIPLCAGGSDDIENLQPLCRECNSGNHTCIDYKARRRADKKLSTGDVVDD